MFTGDTLAAAHQAESIRRLAEALGMTIVREYEEYGSGPGGRPQFRRMMDEAKSEPVPFGAVTSYGRWRSAPCTAGLWKYARELQDAGVELLCAWDKPPRSSQAAQGPAAEGGLGAQGGRAQADPPATWPPTQPSYRAEQPPSLNTSPATPGSLPAQQRQTAPSPMP